MKTAVLIVILFTTIANGLADTVVVSAQANLYGAGHATPPAPSGNGAGVLPPVLTVTAGQSVSFSLMTGTVTHSSGSFSAAIAPFGPEGYNVYNTSLGSLGGISSISGDHFFWLAGVFLDDTEPVNPAPSGLPYFSAAAKQFNSLSPGLRQIFFIGDGQQAGTPQDFIAPTGATRLFLGFIDENSGQVGHYGDNVGSFTVTHNVPEPLALRILRAGSEVHIRWPADITNCQLQATTTLSANPIPWQAVTNSPTVSGNEWVVTKQAAASNEFFRLKGNP